MSFRPETYIDGLRVPPLIEEGGLVNFDALRAEVESELERGSAFVDPSHPYIIACRRPDSDDNRLRIVSSSGDINDARAQVAAFTEEEVETGIASSEFLSANNYHILRIDSRKFLDDPAA